jgi:exonuclease III
MSEMNSDFSFLSWNVRGLNNPAKQEDIKQVIQLHKPSVVNLQETKLAEISVPLIARCLGSAYADNFSYLPADGTRGGILLACKDITYQFSDVLIKTHNFSVGK